MRVPEGLFRTPVSQVKVSVGPTDDQLVLQLVVVVG
jgi:hypothetical protein